MENRLDWPYAAGEMAARVRQHDWAATPLGPVASWPVSLRTMVQAVIAHPFPSIVLWGPELVQVYNDGYRLLMGVKHPAGLGQPTRECWPEVWHINAPIYERVWRGESLSFQDALFPITRFGVLEDAWFTLSYSPVYDEQGRVGGVLLTIIETTARLKAERALRENERRQSFIVKLSDALRPLADPLEIQRTAIGVLREGLDVDRALYAEMTPDGEAFEVTDSVARHGFQPLAGRFPVRDFLVAATRLRRGQVFRVDEVASDPDLGAQEKQAFADLGVQAVLAVSVIKHGRLVSNLAVHQARPRHWHDEDLVLLRETAERIWSAVERAHAGLALRQSEERLALVFDILPVGVGLVDRQGRMLLSNTEMRRYVPSGLMPSRDELQHGLWLVRDPFGRLLPRQDFPGARALRGETVLPGVEMLYTPDDAPPTWVRVAAVPLRDEQGQVTGALTVATDINAMKATAEALSEREERLRLALQVGELATWDWDLRSGRVVWSGEQFRMLGYAPGEVVPSFEAWIDRAHPEDREAALQALRTAREARTALRHELRSVHPDGSVHWLAATGLYFYDAGGEPVRMIGVMRDISDQRGARELLEHKVAERTHMLRQLMWRMQTLEDEERRRIARELHDGLGQYLTAATMMLRSLLEAAQSPLQQMLMQLHELIRQLDHDLDRIVFLVRPTALDDCGLSEGVAAHLRTWSELTGVEADLALEGLDGDRLPPPVEAAVFRVVQEALNNVAKYARARHVSVSLQRRGGRLMGSVEDDGCGFDIAAAGHGRPHWGLLGMQERIEALGGHFTIESTVGVGTAVLWRVPVG